MQVLSARVSATLTRMHASSRTTWPRPHGCGGIGPGCRSFPGQRRARTPVDPHPIDPNPGQLTPIQVNWPPSRPLDRCYALRPQPIPAPSRCSSIQGVAPLPPPPRAGLAAAPPTPVRPASHPVHVPREASRCPHGRRAARTCEGGGDGGSEGGRGERAGRGKEGAG